MAAGVMLAADWEKWTAIGTLAAAGATLVLAGITVWLVFTTRRVVSETAEQLAIERGRIEASQRPYVFPAPSADLYVTPVRTRADTRPSCSQSRTQDQAPP